MLAKTIITCALATVGSAAAVLPRTGGGSGGGDKPTPESCTVRDDGNTSPKYCPNLGGIGVVIPVSLCSIIADVTLGLNVLSCCGASSCVAIDIL
ncbi:hypothetical protein GRF29_103g223312 [Pseudopithomyces chartarum]|uniref:Hydrophobin n=1 Tax=Pseudopithomyces chartarum TaxID=1892770 RepID=A0AAN6LXT8_9PLEO|nr:hypothetical protein GRF29_103g223312 [Pseudopithomyces chartarum]